MIWRLMERPRPVPPNCRLVPESPCWNASKMTACLSRGMPMPVSDTENAITVLAALSSSCSGFQPSVATSIRRVTRPRSVNLNALESRFLSTCCRRRPSVWIAAGRPGTGSTSNCSPLMSAIWRKVPSTNLRSSANVTAPTSICIVPDSILDRSRMSLIRSSRSEPEPWIVCAKPTCLAVRFSSWFSISIWDRMSMLLSGVRSSCDMLARNSDLYFEMRASCSAFSSSATLACSTSWFFCSTSAFCSESSVAFSSSSMFFRVSSSCCCRSSSSDCRSEWVCCSSRLLVSVRVSCWLWRFSVSACDCFRSSSVRMFASIVFSTMPIVSASCSRKVSRIWSNSSKVASSSTALISPSKSTGRMARLRGGASPSPEEIRM